MIPKARRQVNPPASAGTAGPPLQGGPALGPPPSLKSAAAGAAGTQRDEAACVQLSPGLVYNTDPGTCAKAARTHGLRPLPGVPSALLT